MPRGIAPGQRLWVARQIYAVTESIAPARTVTIATAGTLTPANLMPALALHAE